MRYRVLENPVVAVVGAAAIVLVLGSLAASKLPGVESGQNQPQNAQRAMVGSPLYSGLQQPALKVDALTPSASAAPAPASPNVPQIARVGKLSLYVGNVDSAVSALSRLAKRNAGDVFSLDLSHQDGDSGASAQMSLRIPESRFDQAMDSVAAIGKVRERSVSAEDLTSDITDSGARLRNLRQTESDIRAIMDRSGSVSQVMDAENQLSEVREQIETLESELASMKNRVVYATIELDVQTELAPAAVEPTWRAQLANAWARAVHSVSQFTIALMAFGLWLLLFAPYLLLAAAFAWLIYGQLRKHAVRNPG